eukprot:151619_1
MHQCREKYGLHKKKNNQSLILEFKVFQVFIRIIFLSIAIILDLFYFDTFKSGSPVMNKYGSVLRTFTLLMSVLFFIWCICVFVELFASNWIMFCRNMITPKHSQFVLYESTQDIIKKCDEIYTSLSNNQQNSPHDQSYSTKNISASKPFPFYIFISYVLGIHMVFIVFIAIITTNYPQSQMQIHVIALYQSMIISVICLSVFELFRHYRYPRHKMNTRKYIISYICNYSQMTTTVWFTCYISAITVLTHSGTICQLNKCWTSIIILPLIGVVVCTVFMYAAQSLIKVKIFKAALTTVSVTTFVLRLITHYILSFQDVVWVLGCFGLIVLSVIPIIIDTFVICICAQKRKTFFIRNPMVIYLTIGKYQDDPQNPDIDEYRNISDINGIEADIFNLRTLFNEFLNYQCYTFYVNNDRRFPKLEYTKEEIIQFMEQQAEILAHNVNIGSCDGLFVAISGHGHDGKIITSDCKYINQHDIHRIFSKYEESREVPRFFLYDVSDGVEGYDGELWKRGELNPDFNLAMLYGANKGFQARGTSHGGSYFTNAFVHKLMNGLKQRNVPSIGEVFQSVQDRLGAIKQFPVASWNNGTENIRFMVNKPNGQTTKKREFDIRNPQVIFIFIENNLADLDLAHLHELFEETLNYQCHTLSVDGSKKEILQNLQEQAKLLSRNIHDGKCDGLFVVISANSIDGNILLVDATDRAEFSPNELISKHEIHRTFSKYETSRHVPRVFLYDVSDGAETIERRGSDDSNEDKPLWQYGAKNPDYNLAMLSATNKDFQSYLNIGSGSYVISGLVRKLINGLGNLNAPTIGEVFQSLQEELSSKQLPVATWNNNTYNIIFEENTSNIEFEDLTHIRTQQQKNDVENHIPFTKQLSDSKHLLEPWGLQNNIKAPDDPVYWYQMTQSMLTRNIDTVQRELMPLCICGDTLLKTDSRVYDAESGVICDNCGIGCQDDDIVYHCMKGYNAPEHKDGFDLCKKCAMKQNKKVLNWLTDLFEGIIVKIASFVVNKRPSSIFILKNVNKHWYQALNPNKPNVNTLWEYNMCRP